MRLGDGFEFDAVARRLRRQGEDVHLPPKAFELLALLVDASPRVLSKRELHARLWPGGVVADATLAALVKQLRRALRDGPPRNRLIRTVHRVGYALDVVGEDPVPAPVATQRWLIAGHRRLALSPGENIVGRDADAQVQFDDPVISRRHCRFTQQGAHTLLEDLGSKNGTFLDGVKLDGAPVAVRNGSRILLGTLLVTYRESGGSAPTLTHLDRRMPRPG